MPNLPRGDAMVKSLFLLIAFFLFVSLNLIPNLKQRKNLFALYPLAEPTTVEIIALSDRKVFIPCKLGYVPTESCPDKRFINVAVRGAEKLEGGEAEIKYMVSGGQIIGNGKDVKWDFSEVKKAGVFTITVDFVDSENKRQTKTETITVKNCDCPNDCICPKRSVSASKDSIKAGETVTFTAKLEGNLPADFVYTWTVSQGEIIEGHGTAKIKVKTTREMADSELTAIFEVTSHEICSFCESQPSETVQITK